MKAVAYQETDAAIWNAFVDLSKNGTFLFHRNYMDYHSDRFEDASLLFFEKDRLIALFPANRIDKTLVSHGGLTFGGIVSNADMRVSVMLDVFETLLKYARSQSIKTIVYKPVPSIYHQLPAEEDLYALFRCDARLVRREVSSAILLSSEPDYNQNRRRGIKRAKKHGLRIERSFDWQAFMAMVEEILCEKHQVTPTHSASELALLANRFPQNVVLTGICKDGTLLGGVLLYESPTVAHCQYIAACQEGEVLGAMDVLFDHLIRTYTSHKKYFNFGISTEQQGRFLNRGLVRYKESLGGRTVVHDFYEIDV